MTSLRHEVLDVTESPLVQIATVAESMPGSIKLCYGESDEPTPEFICRAAGRAALGGHTFYTHTAGTPELREAIATKVRELHGVTYRPSEIMSTVGGTAGIFTAIRACVGPGDNAVVVSPAYAIFVNGVTMAGGEARSVPLARDGSRFHLDVDRVRAAMDDHTRLVIVNSPSNPTGWVISVDEQRDVAALAERFGARLLADEVYERLVDDAPIAPSFARVVEDKDRLIVINSFSKTYNMTGWRLGWVQSSESVIRQMYKAAEFITSNASALVQQAGIVALRDGEPFIRELRARYRARRAMVVQALSNVAGVSLPAPHGAFYAFPRIEGLTDSSAYALDLLRATGVALAPGSAFGSTGEGHVRLCFAASEGTLATALERFCAHLEGSLRDGAAPTRAGA
ncbi:MAG: pyridoxal phosphate-dependent aminotransferase [Gemmatimonadaceae bacterium]